MEKAVVSIALSTLRDLLLEEAKFLYGVSGEVKGLQTQLKEIECLLKDADKRQHETKSVVNWIAQMKDLAHRAEDAIETYAFHLSSKRQSSFKHLLIRLSCLFTINEGLSLRHIGSEISEIKHEIERVRKSMQEYGIKSIIQGETSTSNHENQKWKWQTFPHEIEDCFVGKEDELKKLVSLIVDDEHRVVSVWGMGGIGKTTIARKVYNHVEIKRWFECFAWVCVTQQCRIRAVLEDVLKQLNPKKRDEVSSMNDAELIGQLCEIQKAKRCIVFLDDVWEIDNWYGLKHAFNMKGLKSKIMLTTRNWNVANVGFEFEVGLLGINDGWELLKNKAFPHNDIPDFTVEKKSFQEVGEKMVSNCGRLPLAISLLGGLLSTRNSLKEWELVKQNMNVYLYEGEGFEKENKIHEVLNLSYEDLPYYLKPCFLYMGQFREDEWISVNVLYRMWIAQGMISHETTKGNESSLVDIAELYLNELASRCIVQVQVEDTIRAEKYRSCKLHDVVRELCLSNGKRDLGFKVLHYQGGKFSTLLHETLSGIETRHLAIYFESGMEAEDDEYRTTHEDSSKHVRSLRFFNDTHGKIKIEFPHNIVDIQKFKLLRVLVFKRLKFAGRKLPKGITNLIHLRYLCLQECELDELPSSISNLTYLDTLDLLFSWNVRVPGIVKKMFRLKHLFLPCYNMKKMGNYRLRLDDGLDELETLFGFNSLVHELKSITRMKNLRHFEAAIYDNESLSAIINAIASNWKGLRFCAIEIKPGCQFISADEGSTNLKKLLTCQNLYNLNINVRIGKLLEGCGNEIMSSTLVRLYLFKCEMEDDPMEIFGKFPYLEDLRLLGRSYVGQEMKCGALGFPRLKNLVLRGLPNLREFRVEKGAMPLVSHIKINHCSSLEMIPDGFRFIATLEKLTIIRMPELDKRVSDEGEDFDKVRYVPSIIILPD